MSVILLSVFSILFLILFQVIYRKSTTDIAFFRGNWFSILKITCELCVCDFYLIKRKIYFLIRSERVAWSERAIASPLTPTLPAECSLLIKYIYIRRFCRHNYRTQRNIVCCCGILY
jgi:hypothetical protein